MSSAGSQPKTLFEKIWDHHVVQPPSAPGMPTVLYIDLHLVHEVTSPQAFAELAARRVPLRRPGRTLATMDHSTPTRSDHVARLPMVDPQAAAQLDRLRENCRRHGVPLFPLGHENQGIVHVIGPELGATQPGMTIVCGDSHTSTHGAFGAFAFGIGSSEVGHVMATQCLLRRPPKTMSIDYRGTLGAAVSAKDLILATIAQIGIDGGTGHVIEYRGEAIRQLDMEGRMTVCNMSIEAGARAGMIAPDDVTFAHLQGRPLAPEGEAWKRAVADWRHWVTDEGATFDRQVEIDAAAIQPMITWGTHPGMAMAVNDRVPREVDVPTAARADFDRARRYMGIAAGEPLLGHKVDVVFIGSCTNSRLSDLEAAARVLDGRRVAPGVRMLVVPGSQRIKQQAEAMGVADVFRRAGADWREAGCSMCLAMNGDRLGAGETAVSTTNRNFEGRQGPGGRTFLASPMTAAASAVRGAITDVRDIL